MEYKPTRSLIYVDVVKEQYRHKLQNWLYKTHIPDSISQFQPYVTKYAFYNALPTPPEGERFGTIRMQLTEHYWMNPEQAAPRIKAFTEVFPLDVLKWQGTIPDDNSDANLEGNDARATGGDNGMPPFIFAFVPVWWEEDFKGKERTVNDGPNYRWQFLIKYPEGITLEENDKWYHEQVIRHPGSASHLNIHPGDKWFYEQVIPAFKDMPEVKRILTSKVIQSVNDCPFQRVVEMWFDGPEEWYQAAVVKAKEIAKPAWAQYDLFPYLKPKFEIASLFLSDYAASDNLTQYRGYITMR